MEEPTRREPSDQNFEENPPFDGQPELDGNNVKPAHDPLHGSMIDLILQQGGKGGNNSFVREMLTVSDQPSELLARTEVTDEEIDDAVLEEAQEQFALYGYTNSGVLRTLKWGLRVSKNREGRREALAMTIADRQFQVARRNGMGQAFEERFTPKQETNMEKAGGA